MDIEQIQTAGLSIPPLASGCEHNHDQLLNGSDDPSQSPTSEEEESDQSENSQQKS